MLNSSIWRFDRKLSVAITAAKTGPESNGNEGVLRIPQSFGITGASPSNFLVLYPGLSLVESYASSEMRLVYSTASVDCTRIIMVKILHEL